MRMRKNESGKKEIGTHNAKNGANGEVNSRILLHI